jgi:ubiquinol-cytochrome c reductase cytochrome b subunit
VRVPRPRRRSPAGERPPEEAVDDRPREPAPTELDRLVGWLDERTGAAQVARVVLHKVFPDHWSFLLGEIALFSYIVLFATGLYLTFFFTADTRPVTYAGPYAPLAGAEVSAAFDSVMRLSFDVRAGLLMRQVHHWAALVFLAAIVVHASRVFFTGAFRRPREINWLIGMTLLLLGLAAGVTGYSLPDDLLSGTGLRIVYSVVLSIPFVGPWLAYLVFGGDFPTAELISRLYVFHIMLLPLLMIGTITLHLGILFLQKHTQFRGGLATEGRVVGRHFWPGQAFRSVGLLFVTAAVLALLGGLVQINPVWVYGPYVPSAAASPAQPDWYVGWLEGALRLGPNWEPTILGVTIPSPFLPGIVAPAIIFGGIILWPFIEARVGGDHREHHLLDLPWEAPVRLAVGSAVLTLFIVLTLAGANDVLAVLFNVDVGALTAVLRVLLIVAPLVVGLVAYRLAIEIRARSGRPLGPEGGSVIRRTDDGGFEEVEP